jgi:hypothetical protein
VAESLLVRLVSVWARATELAVDTPEARYQRIVLVSARPCWSRSYIASGDLSAGEKAIERREEKVPFD